MPTDHSHKESGSEIRSKRNLFNIVLGNWITIASFLGLLIAGTTAWTILTDKTQANTQKISDVAMKQIDDENNIQQAAIVTSSRYAQIETDLTWIKQKLGGPTN
jgi:hypothetical protein